MISETMLCSDATISMIDDAPFIELRRALVPVVLLEQFFDGSARSVQSSGEQYLLICSNAERPIGIIVDRLLDQEDIVVKPLGPLLKNVQGALGAAELGEHGTVIVVDPAAVYRYLQQVAECGRQEEGGDA
jgi:two-component system chemotaxis sensor kinase CheA